MRRLVVGDIHGCCDELAQLLDRVGLAADDEIISVGDLIDRGPDSPAVVRFMRTAPNARVIMGNHEHKHLRAARGEAEPSRSQVLARRQFDEKDYAEAITFFETLPLFLELPEADVMHGCIDPGAPLSAQRPETLLGTMMAELLLRQRYPAPWYDLYDGPKPVIAGHHDYSREGRPLVIRDRVFLIDTGCCYGRALTGILLPEFRFVSVASRRNYWGIAVQQDAGRGTGESS